MKAGVQQPRPTMNKHHVKSHVHAHIYIYIYIYIYVYICICTRIYAHTKRRVHVSYPISAGVEDLEQELVRFGTNRVTVVEVLCGL